ncbi:DUF5060 domain-containing protein [Pararhodonellum marinum]|uniref:DUF5060 domain-containing protein n=1 Tax=Pararhodonellum marinum TaxID=2755358 RepID=UPI00188F1F9A|nr:DUF5060 domain-containing protein [Pararhodonellum marinum]
MKILTLFSVLVMIFMSCKTNPELQKTEQWSVFEIEMKGPEEGNPYMEVSLDAVFTNGDETVNVPGFYDGNGVYRIRFSPPTQGIWDYKTSGSDSQLHSEGSFECVAPSPENHGPLKVINTFYLEYSDGSPYYGVGTTAYQWTSVKQSIQEKTIETLGSSPFNKIRMCFFPKSYIYGNETEPWAYPFKREGEENDYSQPNFEFFQNFDRRVAQLLEMGIQADVILFHPYDQWGYDKMGNDWNERYVRYLMARLSAYRNVWWSLANEWDIPEFKEAIDWEGIGTMLQNEDPHQRLRGIHNWYDTEDHFYDHNQSWITHVSIQSARFYQAIEWRERYQKPVLFDEMRYEGDVPSGWGNLTAEQMSSYFWMAGLSGVYGTHGDTFQNDSDSETEVRWWAKGGTLPGQSAERISFFKSFMEKLPIHEMSPEINSLGKPENLETNVHILSKSGEVYLAYAADSGMEINLTLEGAGKYSMEILDTWNMNSIESKIVDSGPYNFTTTIPYTALVFQKMD